MTHTQEREPRGGGVLAAAPYTSFTLAACKVTLSSLDQTDLPRLACDFSKAILPDTSMTSRVYPRPLFSRYKKQLLVQGNVWTARFWTPVSLFRRKLKWHHKIAPNEFITTYFHHKNSKQFPSWVQIQDHRWNYLSTSVTLPIYPCNGWIVTLRIITTGQFLIWFYKMPAPFNISYPFTEWPIQGDFNFSFIKTWQPKQKCSNVREN